MRRRARYRCLWCRRLDHAGTACTPGFILSGETAARVRILGAWVEELMLAGVGVGRRDLPEDVQRNLVFRMLQVFDEWPPEQWSVDELDQIVDVQLDILKRVLATAVRQDAATLPWPRPPTGSR